MVRVPDWSEDELERRSGALAALLRRLWNTIRDRVSVSVQHEPVITALTTQQVVPEWREALDAQVIGYVRDTYLDAAGVVAETTGVPIGERVGDNLVEAYLVESRDRLWDVGDRVWNRIRAQLVVGQSRGESMTELAARVKEVAGVTDARAMVIARTEVHAALEAGSYAQALFVDPDARKTWISTRDSHTRPTHRAANGQTVAIGEAFDVGRTRLRFPGDPLGAADETVNCRCSVAYDFDMIANIDDGSDDVANDLMSPLQAAFDPAQPRDAHGRWSEMRDIGAGALRDVLKRMSKARVGDKAYKSVTSSDQFGGKGPGGYGEHHADTVSGMPSAVGRYQVYASRINTALRVGDTSGWKTDDQGWVSGFDEEVTAFDQIFNKKRSQLKRDIVVERGVVDPVAVWGENWKKDGSNVGLTWRDPAFVSTTTSNAVANHFATKEHEGTLTGDPVVMRILVPKGTHAMTIGANGANSTYSAEREVLLPRGMVFRVVTDNGVDASGIRRVDVEMIHTELTAATTLDDDDLDGDDDTDTTTPALSLPSSAAGHARLIDEGPIVEVLMNDDDLVAAGRKFDPKKHPRGKDGKFIKKGALHTLLTKPKLHLLDVSKGVKELDQATWDNLTDKQKKKVYDSADKLPTGSNMKLDAIEKLADLSFASPTETTTPKPPSPDSKPSAPKPITSAPKPVIGLKGSPGDSAKITTSVIWGKHPNGAVIVEKPGNERVVWNGESKKYDIQSIGPTGTWTTDKSLTKKDAYAQLKNDTSWKVPGAQQLSTTDDVELLEVSAPTTPTAPMALTPTKQLPTKIPMNSPMDAAGKPLSTPYGVGNIQKQLDEASTRPTDFDESKPLQTGKHAFYVALGSNNFTPGDKDQWHAVRTYQSMVAEVWNKTLRDGKPIEQIDLPEPKKGWVVKAHHQLDKMMDESSLPLGIQAWRGIKDPGGKIAATLKKGSVFEDKAFASLSTEKNVSEGFAGPGGLLFDIEVPAGSRGVVPTQWTTRFLDEWELVLPRGSRFEVVEEPKKIGDHKVAKLRVITDVPSPQPAGALESATPENTSALGFIDTPTTPDLLDESSTSILSETPPSSLADAGWTEPGWMMGFKAAKEFIDDNDWLDGAHVATNADSSKELVYKASLSAGKGGFVLRDHNTGDQLELTKNGAIAQLRATNNALFALNSDGVTKNISLSAPSGTLHMTTAQQKQFDTIQKNYVAGLMTHDEYVEMTSLIPNSPKPLEKWEAELLGAPAAPTSLPNGMSDSNVITNWSDVFAPGAYDVNAIVAISADGKSRLKAPPVLSAKNFVLQRRNADGVWAMVDVVSADNASVKLGGVWLTSSSVKPTSTAPKSNLPKDQPIINDWSATFAKKYAPDQVIATSPSGKTVMTQSHISQSVKLFEYDAEYDDWAFVSILPKDDVATNPDISDVWHAPAFGVNESSDITLETPNTPTTQSVDTLIDEAVDGMIDDEDIPKLIDGVTVEQLSTMSVGKLSSLDDAVQTAYNDNVLGITDHLAWNKKHAQALATSAPTTAPTTAPSTSTTSASFDHPYLDFALAVAEHGGVTKNEAVDLANAMTDEVYQKLTPKQINAIDNGLKAAFFDSTADSALKNWAIKVKNAKDAGVAPPTPTPAPLTPATAPSVAQTTPSINLDPPPTYVTQAMKKHMSGAKTGYWSKPEKIWDEIKKIQSVYPDPNNPGQSKYTPLQIIKGLDSLLKTQEPSPYEKKMVKWAGTVKGQSYTGGTAGVLSSNGAPAGTASTPTPTPSVSTPLGLGTTDISQVTSAKQQETLTILQSKYGSGLHSPAHNAYKALKETADAQGLSLAQVITIADKLFADKLATSGLPPSPVTYKKKITAWLKTPQGAAVASGKKFNPNVGLKADPVTRTPPLSATAKAVGIPSFDAGSAYNYKHITVDGMNQLWKKITGQYGPPTSTETSAIGKYTGASFELINEYLRGKSQASTAPANQAKNIQNAMKPVPKPILLVRGANWLGDANNLADAEKLVGQTWRSHAFMSASVGTYPGYGGGKKMRLEIEVPPGTPALWAEPYSQSQGENEMMLPAGTHLRVISVEKKTIDYETKIYVRMRVVPDSEEVTV